ncbi:MAG: cation:proton antiporter [Prevotella sp.]|nr:cation:proton antiporter [Prevotella sp.]
MLDLSQYFPITNPTLIFFVVLMIILLAPIVMGKLRIPHIIGMVIAGVIVGKHGLNILASDDSFKLFGKVGVYYIMFLAGLEMNMEDLRKNRLKVGIFGIFTFIVPFLLTWLTSVTMLGMGHEESLLMGSVMGANTLIAYPIVGRYGLQRHGSVVLSVGASMIALTLALISLGAVVGSVKGESGLIFWLLFTVKITAFCTLMIFFMPRLCRWFLHRYSDSVMQFIFVMACMFLSAAFSELIGMEGIFGAFFAGLLLNRYIPTLSALMNRIEFTGNALFIPYFLIGVGMDVDISLLFGGGIVWLVVAMVLFGTVGKALAAYSTAVIFKRPLSWGHSMFGLTSAHAAGAIAMAMVGRKLLTADGSPLVSEEVMNGIIVMILFTCIISTIVTDRASQQIVLEEKRFTDMTEMPADDEKILIPVKYPEYAESLLQLAIMMRNSRLNRGVVALNVVYDDVSAKRHQEEGRQLLDHLTRLANASEVPIQTQVRIAANIANGIKHAFKEFQASEIVMGLHFHKEITPKFWGEFTQSLYNGLRQQITIAKVMRPLNTLRLIHVAVPSRAEYEPGFYRWLERLCRMAGNLDCRIQFHGRNESLDLIRRYVLNRHPNVRGEYTYMSHWNELPDIAKLLRDDHILVIVSARKGTVSFKNALERLPEEITRYFPNSNLMIIFPDQYGEPSDVMTFAEAQHHEEMSAYDVIVDMLQRLGRKVTS